MKDLLVSPKAELKFPQVNFKEIQGLGDWESELGQETIKI
jgi:hypothetical protein